MALGGGDRGAFLDVACVPNSTLKSTIDTLVAAGTQVTGTLVKLTYSDDYEVAGCSAGDIPDGKIMAYEKTETSYRLLVRLFSYVDLAGNRHTPVGIANFPYDGTGLGLKDSVLVYANNSRKVKDGTSTGWGAVIAMDTPASGYCDVLF